MKEISVIVPVYNIEKYIGRCIESVLKQSFENFELLLVNDGSSDKSGQICDEYAMKDRRIIVYHKENQGVSSARNLGIRKSTGRYIAFVDGDDWVQSDYLENLYKGLIGEKCDICICGGNEINEYMQELRTCTYNEKLKLSWKDERLYDWPYFTYVIHRMMIKKSVIENVNFDILLPNGEDTLFLTEAFLNAINGVLFLPYIGYSYFIRSESANQHHSYSKKKFSAIIANERRLVKMSETKLSMKNEWYESFVLEAYCLYGYIVDHPEYYTEEHAKILFDYLRKYRKYSTILGTTVKFKILFSCMLCSQKFMEKVLSKSNTPHGHIVGD